MSEDDEIPSQVNKRGDNTARFAIILCVIQRQSLQIQQQYSTIAAHTDNNSGRTYNIDCERRW
jgi:hypothetical protein